MGSFFSLVWSSWRRVALIYISYIQLMQLKYNRTRHFIIILRLGSVSDARGVSSRCSSITCVVPPSLSSWRPAFSLPSLLINHPANDDEKHKREKAKKGKEVIESAILTWHQLKYTYATVIVPFVFHFLFCLRVECWEVSIATNVECSGWVIQLPYSWNGTAIMPSETGLHLNFGTEGANGSLVRSKFNDQNIEDRISSFKWQIKANNEEICRKFEVFMKQFRVSWKNLLRRKVINIWIMLLKQLFCYEYILVEEKENRSESWKQRNTKSLNIESRRNFAMSNIYTFESNDWKINRLPSVISLKKIDHNWSSEN